MARAGGRPARRGRRARGRGRAGGGNALHHARALRPLRAHASVRRRDRRRRSRPCRRGCARPQSEDGRPGLRRLREAGMDVELLDGEPGRRARRQNEAWRTWIAAGRPFVTYKAAAHAGRAGRRPRVPLGHRGGEPPPRARAPRRLGCSRCRDGHGARGCARLDARDVESDRQPRRLAFGTGLPEGSELELVSGPLDEALKRLAAEGVQSLLLEGGPTLASSFLREGSSTSCSSSSRRRWPDRPRAGWTRWAPRSPSPGSRPSGSETTSS